MTYEELENISSMYYEDKRALVMDKATEAFYVISYERAVKDDDDYIRIIKENRKYRHLERSLIVKENNPHFYLLFTIQNYLTGRGPCAWIHQEELARYESALKAMSIFPKFAKDFEITKYAIETDY